MRWTFLSSRRLVRVCVSMRLCVILRARASGMKILAAWFRGVLDFRSRQECAARRNWWISCAWVEGEGESLALPRVCFIQNPGWLVRGNIFFMGLLSSSFKHAFTWAHMYAGLYAGCHWPCLHLGLNKRCSGLHNCQTSGLWNRHRCPLERWCTAVQPTQPPPWNTWPSLNASFRVDSCLSLRLLLNKHS